MCYLRGRASLLLTGSEDKSVQVWDCGETKASRFVSNLRGHDGYISAICAFWDDSAGATLVTASEDQTCKVWDLKHILSLGDAMPRKPPKSKSGRKASTVAKSVPTLFPKVQERVLTQQTAEDCAKTREELKNEAVFGREEVTQEEIGQRLDCFLHAAVSAEEKTRRMLARGVVRYELEKCLFFGGFDYLQRHVVLSLWLAESEPKAEKTVRLSGLLSTIYMNYTACSSQKKPSAAAPTQASPKKGHDKETTIAETEGESRHDELTFFFYISLIMNRLSDSSQQQEEFSQFVSKFRGFERFDLHTRLVAALVLHKSPVQDLVEEYAEAGLLLDGLVLSYIFCGEETSRMILDRMREKLCKSRPAQAEKIAAALARHMVKKE